MKMENRKKFTSVISYKKRVKLLFSLSGNIKNYFCQQFDNTDEISGMRKMKNWKEKVCELSPRTNGKKLLHVQQDYPNSKRSSICHVLSLV